MLRRRPTQRLWPPFISTVRTAPLPHARKRFRRSTTRNRPRHAPSHILRPRPPQQIHSLASSAIVNKRFLHILAMNPRTSTVSFPFTSESKSTFTQPALVTPFFICSSKSPQIRKFHTMSARCIFPSVHPPMRPAIFQIGLCPPPGIFETSLALPTSCGAEEYPPA